MRRLLAILLISVGIAFVGGLPARSAAVPAAASELGSPVATEADSIPSVTCTPFGLYGDITTPPLVDRLSDTGDNLTFVGTTNGLYVVATGGKLHHFLYSPFGIKHVALIDDITDDGFREVVVALNDTQVPALRCYDGATWERLWQFAPMARIWQNGWVSRQLLINNLGVVTCRGRQNVVFTSGRCLFSIDARDGTKQWRFKGPSSLRRMVTLADLNGNGTGEVFTGSDDGRLYLLSGKSGRVLWRTKLPKRDGAEYEDNQRLLSDIAVLDEETGSAVVASTDGWARMYDLKEKRSEWETPILDEDTTEEYSPSVDFLLSPTPDMTGDGLPEILPIEGVFEDYAYSEGKGMLCDSTGEILWRKDAIACSAAGVETGSFEGKPALLQVGSRQIVLVDLKDGVTVLHTIPLDVSDSAGVVVRQPAEDGYLSFSSGGDLAAISAKGDLLWHYPRLTYVATKSGAFVGDGTSDTLFCGEWSSGTENGYPQTATESGGGMTVGAGGSSAAESVVRVLRMLDGATQATVWSYDVPYSVFKNSGLKEVQVTPDLVGGDSIQDIIGYGEDTVFIFDGKNGNPYTIQVGQPIASLDIMRNGASGNAIAVGIEGGLMVFDSAGTLLWTTTSEEWSEDSSGSFMVLDDINSDNMSDLAILCTANITILKSIGTTYHCELHQTFNADANSLIEYAEAIPDADRDGVRDLAYIQREQVRPQAGQYTLPKSPVLVERSLADGKELFTATLPEPSPSIDLACGDFDGDGISDSLVGSADRGIFYLRVLSGKNGYTLGSYVLSLVGRYRGLEGGWSSRRLPAASVGDLNGDGADDLAYSDGYAGNLPGYSRIARIESRLEVRDVIHGKSLATIATSPRLKERDYSGTCSTTPQAQVDADGHLLLVSGVLEPLIPSYDPDADAGYSRASSPQYLAVVDVDSGRCLASFAGFDLDAVSLFESHQPGILGVAGRGGMCLLNTSADLQVTSPREGATKRPILGVKWGGTAGGDFSQVYVDEVRNDMGNDPRGEMYLARGKHEIVVRSVDDCGRVSYSPSDLSTPLTIQVMPSPWKPVLLVLSLFALLAFIVLLSYARMHRMWRARKRAAKA